MYYLKSYLLLFLAGIFGATPAMRDLCARYENSKAVLLLEPVVLAALLLLCSAYLVDGSFNPFLYFRF